MQKTLIVAIFTGFLLHEYAFGCIKNLEPIFTQDYPNLLKVPTMFNTKQNAYLKEQSNQEVDLEGIEISYDNEMEERDAVIRRVVLHFSKTIGNKCEEINIKMREEGKFACRRKQCVMSYVERKDPGSIDVSLSYGNDRYSSGNSLRVNVSFSPGRVRSTATCIAPEISPLVRQVEQELRGQLIPS